MIELMISDCIDCRAKMQQPPVESSFLAALFPFQDSGRSMNEMRSDKNRSPIHTGSATLERGTVKECMKNSSRKRVTSNR